MRHLRNEALCKNARGAFSIGKLLAITLQLSILTGGSRRVTQSARDTRAFAVVHTHNEIYSPAINRLTLLVIMEGLCGRRRDPRRPSGMRALPGKRRRKMPLQKQRVQPGSNLLLFPLIRMQIRRIAYTSNTGKGSSARRRRRENHLRL